MGSLLDFTLWQAAVMHAHGARSSNDTTFSEDPIFSASCHGSPPWDYTLDRTYPVPQNPDR